MSPIDEILALKDSTKFAIAISDHVLRSSRTFEESSEAERVVYCLNELESEVNNGGFEQFFFNTSGDTSFETLEALKAIGAKKALEIVTKAIALYPGGKPPRDRNQRQAALADVPEEILEAWDALDREFYKYPDDLPGLLRAYVAANKDQFRPVGK